MGERICIIIAFYYHFGQFFGEKLAKIAFFWMKIAFFG